MADEKLITRFNFRIDEALRDIASELIKRRGAKDISDYLRGLLIIDALAASIPVTGIDIPGWLNDKRIEICLKKEAEIDIHKEVKSDKEVLESRRGKKMG